MARNLDDVVSSIPDVSRWKLDQEIDFEHRDIRGQVIPEHLGRIADSMVDWEGRIADLLGLSDVDRSDIRAKNLNKPKMQRREALSIWKSRLGSGATYRALIEVFIKAGRLDYAEFLCDLLKDTGTSGVPGNMSSDQVKFVTSIRKKYQERRINCEKQWPPCHSNKLVRLELVEREKGEGYSASAQRGREDKGAKQTPLAYSDLFKVEGGKRPVRKVLVEGDAGIGKTTLCISVSEDWANGKLFQQFELVLHLPLRMKVVASAGSLSELLKLLHPSPDVCESVAKYLVKEEGESVLIIADGWDELSESERQEESFLYQLLFQEFPLMSVVVTSRLSASAPLHQLPCIDRFVEVRGFSKEHIVEYIQSEFASDQEKAGRLLEQLEDNPLVDSVCSVPLNCAIVCHLWRTLKEALPTTMTELYTKIILNLVLRNMQKIDTYNTLSCLSKFDSLPPDLQQPWWLLCEFAFQTLEKDQLVFSQEELEALASDKRILCFGLLQSAESVLETGFGKSFHFLHLTFQEYLAALHLARQPPDKQLDVFRSHKPKDRWSPNRFALVNKFFFGINCFVDINFEIGTKSFIQQIFKYVAGETTYNLDTLVLCHCAFEAHNDLVNSLMIWYIYDTHSRIGSSVVFGFPRTAHDCTAVLYVLANMQEHCDMAINFDNCGVRESQIKKLVDILASKEGKLQITKLNLSGNRLTVSCLQALENAVRGDLFAKLEWLNLAGSLTSDADTNVSFVEALSTHCPHLDCLNLSNNNLSVPGASAISKIFEQNDHRYSIICLNKTNLGDEGLTILIKSLKVVSFLALTDNDIHATAVSCLADAVCEGKMVVVRNMVVGFISEFDLSNNPLGLEGTVAIGRMLSSSHCQLHSVQLSRCELTTAGGSLLNTDSGNTISGEAVRDVGQQLCQMPQNSTTMRLMLDGNSFTGEGIHILAGFMHLCPCLKSLSTSNCGITSDDLIRLFDKLAKLKSSSPSLCSKLESWNLRNNQIDDSGVSALMDHLPSLFPCLGCDPFDGIYLDSNPVSSEMVKRLKEEVRRRLPEVRWHPIQSLLTSQSSSQSHSKSSCGDLFKEQEQPVSSSLALPSTVSDQLTGGTLSPESASGDNIESVAGTSTLLPSPPPSLSSATLSLSDAVQCAEQQEDHQLQQRSCSDTASGDSLDLRPPSPKRPKQDLTSLTDVEHRFVDLIKWEDENGVKRELRIYSEIAHKWRQIGTRLGFELGEIESVEENHHRNSARITAVLRRWFENAKNLPNGSRYPKSWQGLINLLEDTELGEAAGELEKALSSPQNSVRGNLS